MEVTGEQLIHGIADVFASNNLLRYARKNDSDPHLRMITGATMAGLGFTFGPELEERLTRLHDPEVSEQIKKRTIYAAGGAALGGVLAYLSGPELHSMKESHHNRPIVEPPGGLMTVTSVGWLGYSVLYHKKDAVERERQLWGLGAGSIGYLTGPEMLNKLRGLVIPKGAEKDAVEVYSRGAAVFGALAGGTLGWMFTPKEAPL